jgi:hypothetical protein
MKSKLLGCIAATALGAAIAVATPAMAFHDGGGSRGGMATGRSVFVPGGNRFVGAPFAGRLRNHNRSPNSAFVGAPFFFYDYLAYGNGCWQQVWASYGLQWINVCDDSDYGD